jgi:hypothetical protein
VAKHVTCIRGTAVLKVVEEEPEGMTKIVRGCGDCVVGGGATAD